MNMAIEFAVDRASSSQVADHLRCCDAQFVPPLSARVDIPSYAQKIVGRATRFEAWSNGNVVGIVAAYFNDAAGQVAHITNVSVVPAWTGRGLAAALVRQCIDHGRRSGMLSISLEVAADNAAARRLYEQAGFQTIDPQAPNLTMRLPLCEGSDMSGQRDYNAEIKDNDARRYAYGFDLDVMHPYMIKSFEPFFRQGSLLELGSFQGDFTRRFLPYFSDVTCVEASDAALFEAKEKLGDRVTFVHSLFETATLPKRYENIVLTHVLEHIDDPVRVLRRINDEWLADGGRFFLVCPNANAPSRQIAVKMGLITHNAPDAVRGRARAPLHLFARHARARRRRGRPQGGPPFRDFLQGPGQFPVGPSAANRHHLKGIPRRLLSTRPAVPRPVLEHLPAV